MKNAAIGILIAVVVVLLVGFTRLAHKNSDLRRWNEALKTKVNDLSTRLKEAESNQQVDGTRP